MAVSKLKAHLRRIGARTVDDRWKAVDSICDLYSPAECKKPSPQQAMGPIIRSMI